MGIALVLFSLSVLLVLGAAFFGLSRIRKRPKPQTSPYAKAPRDWPDIPVNTLSLFHPHGRINQHMPSTKKANVLRFQSYDRTQSFVMDLVGQSAPHTPKIALQLSQEDGPDWTDVMLDGCIVAHVQTSALTRGRPAH